MTMKSISWDTLCLNSAMLADVSSVANNFDSNHPSFELMCTLMQRVNWAKTELGLTMDGNASSLSSFYSSLMITFLTMISKLSVTSEFAQFLQQVAPTLPWYHIAPEQYTVLLTTCGSLVNASDDANGKVRSVLVMRLLRMAAAMKFDAYTDARCLAGLEKGAHYAILMRSALESLAPILQETTTGNGSEDGGLASKEAAALPFAPYDFVQLYYEFMKEAEASLASYRDATGRPFISLSGCPPALLAIVCQLISMLNVPGVPFRDARENSSGAGDSILQQIDSLLTAVGVMPLGSSTHTDVPSHDADIGQVYSTWKDTWGYLAPGLLSAHRSQCLASGAGCGGLLWMFVHNNPSFAPLVTFCSLQTIPHVDTIIEKALSSWNDAPYSSWHEMLSTMHVHFTRLSPEQWALLTTSSLENGSSLTLFAIAMWQIKNGHDKFATLSTIVSWIQNINLKPLQAYQVFHLASTALFLFADSTVQSASTVKLIRDFSDAWMKLADDSSGFIFKSKSKYSPKVRLSARAIALFCRVNSKRGSFGPAP